MSNDGLVAADLLELDPQKRLIRTEISLLLRLCGDQGWSFDAPAKDTLLNYVQSAEQLLEELHFTFLKTSDMDPSDVRDASSVFGQISMQEPIFYSGESAYDFQYKDLGARKYRYDNDWLLRNKGYTVEQAVSVIDGIWEILTMRANMLGLDGRELDECDCLGAFVINSSELSSIIGLEIEVVTAFLDSFTFGKEKEYPKYESIFDFNVLNAYPIVRYKENVYLILQWYSLVEAFYETPMFWFLEDDQYKAESSRNRGVFTEEFSEERLVSVFGRERVFKNVDIYKTKSERIGEIDVLVLFSDRAIVLQAKSKKLTIAAKKGSRKHLQDDFKKAVQDSYDQAFLCSKALLDKSTICKDADGNLLEFRRDFQEIYPICVVSDHYPSLTFQVREFLKLDSSDKIMPPFVMDVFFLDVLSEMLRSPLLFISYVNRRVLYGNKLLASSELIILSYHLRKNLWMRDEVSMMHLSDEISYDLDIAMIARRSGMPGAKTPDGILTRYANTLFGDFLTNIKNVDLDGVLDLGFLFLKIDEDGVEYINEGIRQMSAMYKRDTSVQLASIRCPVKHRCQAACER